MSDDLMKKLLSQIGDDVQEVYSHEALFRAAAARIAALEAARMAYARELGCDVGSIHETIRAMKAEFADALGLGAQARMASFMGEGYALVEARAEAAEAERDRLQSEQEQLLADSAIRSDQREQYEKLCGRLSVGKASQQEAIDAIKALCRDNERLALWRGKSREKLRAALQAHHDWHLAQDRDGSAWGIDPVDAYSESGLCEQTIAALGDGQ